MLKVKYLKQTQRRLAALLMILVLATPALIGQEVIADEVIAVIGKHIVLKSDLENSYYQYRAQKGIQGAESTIKCEILEGLMFAKLLLHHGEVDSVEVSDNQVNSAIDNRMNYFMRQFGTEKAMEDYYNKPVATIREEMTELVKEQMIADGKQREVVSGLTVTPSEVKYFFKKIPKDSIPKINSTYEIAQIVKTPIISQEVKDEVYGRMEGIRNRIIAGESFEPFAIMFSDDPGSAEKGGETGITKRGSWDPEFEMAAFALKAGEVSEIIESEFGYHIIKYVERRGDLMNVKHILLMIKPSYQDIAKSHSFLDSVSKLISNDSITFDLAVRRFSDDPGRISGGYIINQKTGNSQFREEGLDPAIAYTVKKMAVGDISSPVAFKNRDRKDSYRILYLSTKSLPHIANMLEDYDLIQNWALEKKRKKILEEWGAEQIKKTYIRLNKDYKSCKFKNEWK